ncbi:MAG: hypothetical protein A3D67_00420 [Candidatus Lloydbacteria bacterium RIFCSPHIGHO2_02_FULL_51_22]|uniref:SpoVR family protein n=2 Tax=Candidatus Lloydiibacteriota TaxID=1817910 RepID=A0A1G2DEC2_9BACT|nr:MAG: hypothetical protein A3D67_00420 [Candidatus Lloydbacteria bacterium RIFCSPHIGHO2_02_FULL_51_22]OGZ17306.1 MAG: hypothetical protein A3G11_01910 [Candidatus Lloydbacteria bacterium RIFCSPLOWO2_12_FULL_51_9]
MTKNELDRLVVLEKRIAEIAKEFGLSTVPIEFEVVTAQKMLEAMAYHFPTNFRHWTFGRDYERQRTLYENTGGGIPYEVVWNFETPRALLVETNPFPLNVTTIAHVYGHVDFFRENRFTREGLAVSDIANEAREAAERFHRYEEQHGEEDVERVIDACMSLQWQRHPDPFFEEPEEEEIRARLIQIARADLERGKDVVSEFQKTPTREEVKDTEKRLRALGRHTPPQPVHDLLWYIARKSPKPLRPWVTDIMETVRHQARALIFNGRTQILNEGWAVYWHVRIMRRLFEEGLLTPKEHGVFNDFHSGVLRPSRHSLNPYSVGVALYEHVEERWNRGLFGREYEECDDPMKKAYWDTKAGLGRQKVFEIRAHFSDRMAIENFFDASFIHKTKLYIYETEIDEDTDEVVYVVVEDDPKIIREVLRKSRALYGIPIIAITDGNYGQRGELYLKHQFEGVELDPEYRDGTLKNIHYLWGRPVHLETVFEEKVTLFTYDGKKVLSVSDERQQHDDGLMNI